MLRGMWGLWDPLELCVKRPTSSHRRCRQELGSAGYPHSYFKLLESTYSQPQRNATNGAQRGSTIASDQCQQFVRQCIGSVQGKGCTLPSCAILPALLSCRLRLRRWGSLQIDSCWLCKLTQQPGVSRKVESHIKQWFEVVGSIVTRWWLCSAADRNHIPIQPILGQVEWATQTELPIMETAVQAEGCKGFKLPPLLSKVTAPPAQGVLWWSDLGRRWRSCSKKLAGYTVLRRVNERVLFKTLQEEILRLHSSDLKGLPSKELRQQTAPWRRKCHGLWPPMCPGLS